MNRERQALKIYQAALGLEGEQRREFVARESADEPELKHRVVCLLEAAERAEDCGFLDRSGGANVKSLAETPAATQRTRSAPPEIDRYRLIEPLGEGGFGTVYLAEQLEPVQREVALKLIRADRCDESFVRRFEAERQVLALLDHPGIAKIFDAGTTRTGEPFLVMERCDGESITHYCDHRRLGIDQRIELFMKVCAALQHAHQKGVIHRDIKPANVLVADQDGRAVPKVIDFGIARAADLRVNERTVQTEGGVFGSPTYMSPEQVDPRENLDIDTRADVYSLGVLLYELLAGMTPFEAPQGSLFQVLQQIRECDPPRASQQAGSIGPEIAGRRGVDSETLARQLRGDLDWILLKALEKDRDRRYESAAALAVDLRRYLASEPVEARPPSMTYRARKFVQRNTATVAATGLLLVTLVAGLAGTSVGFLRAREETARARETLSLLQEFLASPAPDVQGKDLKVVELLESFEPRLAALSDRTAVQADLFHTYGATYLALGLFDRAAEFAQRTLTLRSMLHGDRHPQTLAAIHLLGNIRLEQGEYDEAARLQRRAHEQARAVLDEDDIRTSDYAVGLAEALDKLGQHERAVVLLRDALDKRRTLLGPDHDATLHSMNRLGQALFSLGRQEEGLAWAREATVRRNEHFGPDHPETLHAMSNQSYMLGEIGRYKEAASMDQEILARRERVLGEEHRKTVVSMINLAWILDKLGRYEDSIALNQRALEILERTLGPDSPDTLTTKGNLGMAFLNRGDAPAAERVMREVIEGRTRVLGPEHPVTLVSVGNLVTILRQQDRFEEAIPMVRDLIEQRTAVHGPEHHNTLVAQFQLSSLLSDIGQFEEAETWARRTLGPRSELSGPDNIQTAAVKYSLARAMNGLGELDQAESLVREVLAIRKRELGPDHPGTLSSLELLGDIRARQGQIDEAEVIFRQVLEQ